jgi:hypothetical protein
MFMSMGWHEVSELRPPTGLLFISQVIYEYGELREKMMITGENQRTQRKPCLSATLSTTNPTWIHPGAHLSLCVDRPATNRLSYGTAISLDKLWRNKREHILKVFKIISEDKWLVLGLWLCKHERLPWCWTLQASLKRLSTSTSLHGTVSQKAVIFILDARRTWNLTRCRIIYMFLGVCFSFLSKYQVKLTENGQ